MKRILTCLDGSPRAAHVLATAATIARQSGGKLALFRSVGLDPELRHDVIGVSANELTERLLASAKSDLGALAKAIPPELIFACAAKVGIPWDAICREAKDLDCDLIVIGSHGYGGLDRLLGTTAARVVNHADRSVLVVR